MSRKKIWESADKKSRIVLIDEPPEHPNSVQRYLYVEEQASQDILGTPIYQRVMVSEELIVALLRSQPIPPEDLP